jgi:hypothetical protein
VTGSAPTELADERVVWTDSASDLQKGADVVEFADEFAATVLLEHFAETSPAPAR